MSFIPIARGLPYRSSEDGGEIVVVQLHHFMASINNCYFRKYKCYQIFQKVLFHRLSKSSIVREQMLHILSRNLNP